MFRFEKFSVEKRLGDNVGLAVDGALNLKHHLSLIQFRDDDVLDLGGNGLKLHIGKGHRVTRKCPTLTPWARISRTARRAERETQP